MSYACTVCGEIKEEEVAQQVFHTPGPIATATTDQICIVCEMVLKEALGEPEPTEPEAQPEAEPVEDHWRILGNIFAISVAATLSAAAVIILWKKECAVQDPQETKEMQETQS